VIIEIRPVRNGLYWMPTNLQVGLHFVTACVLLSASPIMLDLTDEASKLPLNLSEINTNPTPDIFCQRASPGIHCASYLSGVPWRWFTDFNGSLPLACPSAAYIHAMALPPVTVHIKRKATDEPVDYLRGSLHLQLKIQC
jgi:hypothetical protein